MDVGNFNGDVMHSRPPPGEKLPNCRFGSERLEQFHVRITHRQHAHLDALLGHLFGGINVKAERVAPDCQPVFDAFSGDSDVIYLQQLAQSPRPQNKGLDAALQLRQRAGQA